jgi:hypothetical protein
MALGRFRVIPAGPLGERLGWAGDWLLDRAVPHSRGWWLASAPELPVVDQAE